MLMTAKLSVSLHRHAQPPAENVILRQHDAHLRKQYCSSEMGVREAERKGRLPERSHQPD